MRAPLGIAVVAAVVLSPWAPAIFAVTTYTTAVVGDFPGASHTRLRSINESGTVVGTATLAAFGEPVAFRWDARQGFRPLFDIPTGGFFRGTEATGINASGDVIGLWRHCFIDDCGTPRGFLLSRAGFHDLDPFIPWAINDSGTLAGSCFFDPEDACISQKGTVSVLARNASAVAINNRGDVVGATIDPDSFAPTAVWWPKHGDAIALEPGAAQDINERGMIVGYSLVPEGSTVATVWVNGAAITFPSVATASVGHAINARGWVVGDIFDEFSSQAFAWNALTGEVVHLGTPSSIARDINNRGEIVGEQDGAAVVWRLHR